MEAELLQNSCTRNSPYMPRALGAGLKKLKETEDQVANLQSGLAEKEKMLTAKNKEAEETLGGAVLGYQCAGARPSPSEDDVPDGEGPGRGRGAEAGLPEALGQAVALRLSSAKLPRSRRPPEVDLAEQSKVIDERRGEIQKKIEEVEPALEAAKSAVGAVNKQALDEPLPWATQSAKLS